MLKGFLKKYLSYSTRIKLRKLPKRLKRKFRNTTKNIKAICISNNLTKLGEFYQTDKTNGHFYLDHYALHLKKFKFKKIHLLEIGVGGYEDPNSGGNSLRMWKKYFPFGRIFSIDICDKSPIQENRIKIFRGNQVDKDFLKNVTDEIGEIDIIIDDGSHINEHVIESFKILFPKLNDGGIYVVEDTQTSYWIDKGGDSENLNNPKTMMSFFKGLTDGLNNKEFIISNYEQSYFDKKIISIHFYHNLIFIYKGNNDEESNLIINNIR